MDTLGKFLKTVEKHAANGVDVTKYINSAKEIAAGCPSDLARIEKTELDCVKSGDWMQDYYNNSAGGSVINSYKSGAVRTIKV